MKRTRSHGTVLLAAMLVLLAGAAAKAQPSLPEGVTATALGERIEHFDFHSAALNKPMAFAVVYPRGYRAEGKPWPVLFFLHGLGRKETTLMDDAQCRAQLLEQPYVIVLPRGENGWYFDSPVDPARHYAQYLDEVTALAGRVANISSERSQRAVGGWSAGGFGSIWACLRHPEAFSTLATIIAVADFPASNAGFPVAVQTFGSDPARWAEYNPLPRAGDLKGHNILLVIGEQAFDAVMNERLSSALTCKSIPHEVKRLSSGHTFPTVQAGLGPVLNFVGKHIAEGAPR